jgi:hypothetical protein
MKVRARLIQDPSGTNECYDGKMRFIAEIDIESPQEPEINQEITFEFADDRSLTYVIHRIIWNKDEEQKTIIEIMQKGHGILAKNDYIAQGWKITEEWKGKRFNLMNKN